MRTAKIGALCIAVVFVVGSVFFYTKSRNSSNALPLPYSMIDVDILLAASPHAMEEISIGRQDAPLTIVEYASMTCFHCAEFHNKTFKKIEDKYIKTGKVRFIFREFPLDSVSTTASMLARCAENRVKGGYFGFVSMLFKKQNDWIESKNYRESMFNMAKVAGFSRDDFDSCLGNQSILNDIKTGNKIAVEKLLINSTPSFFIGGNLYLGDMSEEVFSKIIDSMIEKDS
ncbi:DsbA family protein [Candidatus Liberibacter solanacearum]|uniref:Disulfide bond formation protein DsbA n=1 Tax=Candidatus Liberibacter solanacearum TaxID=556287 RepID=A0A1V2N870_9HYPH|nr:DsbA family protein [Candidatus Liberibacter solanacearum]ONI59132.1 disulfide bond formation protein DsbA [Candidatus Liberibacter solanacearum]ONI59926.1 disulfide bond formation protein DsbA [Candidatus Liberibacter solanacearum]